VPEGPQPAHCPVPVADGFNLCTRPAKAQRSSTQSEGRWPGQDPWPPNYCSRVPNDVHSTGRRRDSPPPALRLLRIQVVSSNCEGPRQLVRCFSNRSHGNRLIVPRPSRRESPLTCTYRTVARPFFPLRRPGRRHTVTLSRDQDSVTAPLLIPTDKTYASLASVQPLRHA